MDPLSEVLISEGIVSGDVLLDIKRRTKGQNFIHELYNTASFNEDELCRIFTTRYRFRKADLSDIPPEILTKFSKDNVYKYLCMPFGWEGRSLKVAMLDPLDLNAIQAISFTTGFAAVPYVTTKTELMAAVNTYYEMNFALAKVLDGVVAVKDSSGDIVEIVEAEKEAEKNIDELFQTGKREELSSENDLLAPAIKLVNILIRDAVEGNASDIHIEPGQKLVTVRFRIDGVLKTQTQIPKWMHSAIVSRIKIMSKLDISNRKTPQDGGVKLRVGDKPLDLRVSVLPTHLGEKVVIRVLRPSEGFHSLQSLLNAGDYARLKKYITKPQGLILVTGPTGSGKTTTLHSILKEVYSEGTNIITVEDPVEYELEGITQVQVSEKAGLTFANTLRSILRQDPDIVMVGEIRDLETAEIALRASMTGHLVLSTLHTMGTAATVMRLFDIGVEATLVASSLLCIVAQRLVRVNCRHCIGQYTPEKTLLATLPEVKTGARFMKGAGCDKCNNTGYQGRTTVLEIMEITPEVRKMIAVSGTAGALRELSRKEGMRTLFEAAMEQVYAGTTTVEEVLRVIAAEERTTPAPDKKEAEAAPAAVPVPELVCPNCARSYMEDECPYCGKTSEELCNGCGSGLESHWQFCPVCGKSRGLAKVLPKVAEKAKVLIVDDEPGILKMVELSLKPLDLEVHTAQNGREGLDKARALNPHLVITDINMPVMDGYALIRELRSRVNTMFIPIVILSSRDTAEDRLKGFTYGTDDYITKPFDYTELQARVKRLMKRTYE